MSRAGDCVHRLQPSHLSELADSSRQRVCATATGTDSQRGVEHGFCERQPSGGWRLKYLTVADDFSHESVDIVVVFGFSGQYFTRVLDQAAPFREQSDLYRVRVPADHELHENAAFRAIVGTVSI